MSAAHENAPAGTEAVKVVHSKHHTFSRTLAQRINPKPCKDAGAIELAFIRAIFGGASHE